MNWLVPTIDKRLPTRMALLATLVPLLMMSLGLSVSVGHASQGRLTATYVSTSAMERDPFQLLMAFGLTAAGHACGVQTSVVPSNGSTNLVDNFKAAIRHGSNLIVTSSFDSVAAITRLSKQYPQQNWAVVDSSIPGNPRVRGIAFMEQQGMFLVGVIFGLLATGHYSGWPRSNAVGFVGAANTALVRPWYDGLYQGVKYVNPRATVLAGWGSGFDDPATARKLALAQFAQGAQYIAAAAAAGNTGVFAAAREKNFYTSGTDVDQRPVDPQHILVSMVKRSDLAVRDAVCDLAHGTFTGGTHVYDLQQKAVGPDFVILPAHDQAFPSHVPAPVQARVRQLAALIVSGKITVHA